MHKSIRLKVVLWIEGEDEPAHDYAAMTIQLVRDLLAAPHPNTPTLQVTVKRLVEAADEDWDPSMEPETKMDRMDNLDQGVGTSRV